MVVSISQQVFHQGDLVGITGIDVSLTDIAEDISYFINSDQLYIFLVEESGTSILCIFLSISIYRELMVTNNFTYFCHFCKN